MSSRGYMNFFSPSRTFVQASWGRALYACACKGNYTWKTHIIAAIRRALAISLLDWITSELDTRFSAICNKASKVYMIVSDPFPLRSTPDVTSLINILNDMG